MSCPNRCSNDYKVKNFPDEIECVVAQKIGFSSVVPEIPIDVTSLSRLPRIQTGLAGEIGSIATAVTDAIAAGTLKKGDLFFATAPGLSVGILQIVQ